MANPMPAGVTALLNDPKMIGTRGASLMRNLLWLVGELPAQRIAFFDGMLGLLLACEPATPKPRARRPRRK